MDQETQFQLTTLASESLRRLRAGNEDYLAARHAGILYGPDRRESAVAGQRPFAVVVSCSDSRVPPEPIFSQGLGDLFVIRVAGLVPDRGVLASIEFAVETLGSPLVLAVGHTRCGAIQAAMEWDPEGDGAPCSDNMRFLLNELRPAVDGLPSGEEGWRQAVHAGVRHSMERILAGSTFIRGAVRDGRLGITGAVYHLESGVVEFQEPAPSAGI